MPRIFLFFRLIFTKNQEMQTIQLKSEVPLGDVLEGMETLSVEDLETVLHKVLHIRAKKIAPSLSKRETELFEHINATLPDELQERYYELDEKRELDTLTDEEYQELMGLIGQNEVLELKRLESLVELSKIRGVPFRTLIKQLGIQPREPHD